MRKISILMALVFLTFFILICSSLQANAYSTSLHDQNSRQALEIIIGGGGGAPSPDYPECPPPPSPPEPECPPPPPPPPPPPLPPPPLPPPPPPRLNPPKPPSMPSPKPFDDFSELKAIIPVIQNFGKRITYDPQGIVKTWTGDKLCRDPSKYKGFYCARIPGDKKFRLAGIDFNGYHFNGKANVNLTNFIEQLKYLVFFHANSNNFTGIIPAKIKKLTYFYELDLSNNKLQGPFPTSVLAFKNLTFLDLRFNFLTGRVPPEVFTMDLDVLFLNNNKFIGEIPDTIGKTPALYLTLANNRFTGPIPKTIGQAKDALVEVLLLNNRLSGCLPYEIGLLKIATVFDASQNQLTGPIPHSFACLEKIALLNLSSNQLYGPVPETLCRLKNLYRLTLKDNYFTQVGPECMKLIRRRKLDVRMNCILGLPFQKSAAQCKDFFSVRRTCPDQRSMSYVPCHLDQSHLRESSEEESDEPTLVPAPSPSYAALEMYRL